MNDPIDRQAAIDALDEIESEVADGYGYQYEKWRKYFCELPSAQPELSEIKRDLSDLISRQAAIDEIKALYEWHDTVTEDRTIDHLKRLPSAQPEIIRCKDCKHHGTNGYRLNCVVFCCTMPDDGFCSCGERREDG